MTPRARASWMTACPMSNSLAPDCTSTWAKALVSPGWSFPEMLISTISGTERRCAAKTSMGCEQLISTDYCQVNSLKIRGLGKFYDQNLNPAAAQGYPEIPEDYLLRFVHRLPTNNGAQYSCSENLRWRSPGNVAVEHDEICEIAGRENAFCLLLEFRISRAQGVCVNRLMDIELLLGIVRLGSSFVHASHGGIETAKRSNRLDGIIGPKGEMSCALEKRRPGIRSLRALRPNSGLSPVHVGQQMIWLHRRKDAQFAKAWDACWSDHLRMLHAEAEIERRLRSARWWKVRFLGLLQSCVEGVEGHVHASVPNRMKPHLEPCGRTLDRHLR